MKEAKRLAQSHTLIGELNLNPHSLIPEPQLLTMVFYVTKCSRVARNGKADHLMDILSVINCTAPPSESSLGLALCLVIVTELRKRQTQR